MTRQFDKKHAETVVATAAIVANRFVCRAGTHAPAAPANGNQDSIGIAEESAAVGEAIPAVTEYSYLVEASAAITKGAYLKPAADGSGKAAVGAMATSSVPRPRMPSSVRAIARGLCRST